MEWKSKSPSDACDLIAQWDRVSWPIDIATGYEIAQRSFGWTLLNDGKYDYLENQIDGYSNSEVPMTELPTGVAKIGMALSDMVRPSTTRSINDLGDQFALTVREAAARWGRPELSRRGDSAVATFDLPAGGVAEFSGSPFSVRAAYFTPQYVAHNARETS